MREEEAAMQGGVRAGPAREAASMPAYEMLNLRVVKGMHRGALTAIAPSDVVLVGADEDCDVILHDAGVARHHCVLSNLDSKLFLRAIDEPLTLDGRPLDPGRSVCVKPGTCIELGSTAFD